MQNNKYLYNAVLYDQLSQFYKYSNPDLFVHYYYKHLKSMNQAASHMRSLQGAKPDSIPARVRVLHAFPDAPNVDVYVNETRILQNFPYRDISNYMSLPEGTYQIDIYPTGQQVQTVLSQKVSPQSGMLYTLAAAGQAKSLKLIVIKDDPHVPNDETKLRVIHLSPDSPPVDIAVKGRDVIFSNAAYRKPTKYLALTPMTVDLEVRAAGSKEPILPLDGITLIKNTPYSLYIIGLSQGSPGLEPLFLAP
ncbi:DUF4397 domain-containing protein [Bacillus sp. MUM 13]|uniref:DUF4397 domain-containing protein n=1 Tax=Bacillus sp. MUM 13 TaxID=1678001 RepID=UPI0008F5BFAA|nr:DUF4397 domain-containing protein [Bacillus sp. MUM 13]OIK12418.1 hypothetical protein BIV59_08905 [Bacillus sp. MUM 13]